MNIGGKSAGNPVFPDTDLLSSEHPVPDRRRSAFSEKPAGSGKTEHYEAFLPDFVVTSKLKEFFKIPCGLAEKGPHPVSFQPEPQTFSEAPQIYIKPDSIRIKLFVTGISDENFNGDRKALTVKGELLRRSELAGRGRRCGPLYDALRQVSAGSAPRGGRVRGREL